MDDLISRAAALDVIDNERKLLIEQNRLGAEHVIVHHARGLIEDLSTVDAVEVVRCWDCKYGDPDTNGNGENMVMCHNKLNPVGFEDWLMPPEWFCADGERREEAKRE